MIFYTCWCSISAEREQAGYENHIC